MRNRADKKLQTDRRTDGQADSYIPPNRVLGGIIKLQITSKGTDGSEKWAHKSMAILDDVHSPR